MERGEKTVFKFILLVYSYSKVSIKTKICPDVNDTLFDLSSSGIFLGEMHMFRQVLFWARTQGNHQKH